ESVDCALRLLLYEALAAPAGRDRKDRTGACESPAAQQVQIVGLEARVGLVAEEGDQEEVRRGGPGGGRGLRTPTRSERVEPVIRIGRGQPDHFFGQGRDLDEERRRPDRQREIVLAQSTEAGGNGGRRVPGRRVRRRAG